MASYKAKRRKSKRSYIKRIVGANDYNKEQLVGRLENYKKTQERKGLK